jgi:transcriptional regulator with XRE-family HTH domain
MFGTRLHTLRKERKLRQEDMAKQLGIARTTYAMYEQGKREPDYNTLIKLATFFEVSIDYLLGTTPEIKQVTDIQDPELYQWFKDIKNATPQKREELKKKFWEFIIQKRRLNYLKDLHLDRVEVLSSMPVGFIIVETVSN